MRPIRGCNIRLVGPVAGAILGATAVLIPVAPALADGGSISLSEAYGRTATADGPLLIGDRTSGTPVSGTALFKPAARQGRRSDRSQSGIDTPAIGTQTGREAALTADQSGNRLAVTQGDLAGLRVSQNGANNEIQVLRTGQNASAAITQTGSYNVVSGTQSGSDNVASVIQSGLHHTVAYTQSGTGSTLTVRQH